MKRFILQRYVLRELISPTLLGLVVFTFIFLVRHLFDVVELLVSGSVPTWLIGGLMGTMLPPLLVLTIPMALLVGTLLGVGRLAADNEIMAMRTSGVHLMRIFLPVILVACLLMGGLSYASARTVPRLVDMNINLLNQIKYFVNSFIEAGRRFEPKTSGGQDVALYFQRRNPETQRMEQIALEVVVTDAEDRSKREIFITSREGWIEPDPTLGLMDVTLSSGTIHMFDTATSLTAMRYYVGEFSELKWSVELVRSGRRYRPGRLPRKPSALTNPEIRELLNVGVPLPVDLSSTQTQPWTAPGSTELASGYEMVENDDGTTMVVKMVDLDSDDEGALRAELHQRRSIVLACLAFVLLGAPLAIRVRPTGRAIAFCIAFILILFYYGMLKWGVSLSQGGSALGVIIIYFPNLLVGGTGILLFFRTVRQ